MRNRLGNAWWIAIGIQLLLLIVAVFVLVPLVADRSLAEDMGETIWFQRNRNAARQLIPYLQLTLQLGATAAVVIPVLCTLAWFGYLRYAVVDAPGEASRAFRVWYFLGGIGTLICFAFGFALMWTSSLHMLVDPDISDIFDRIKPIARLKIVGGILIYFWVSFYLIGTLFTTPPLFRTAVPLASLR